MDRFEIEEQLELLKEELEFFENEEYLKEYESMLEIYENFDWDLLEHYKNVKDFIIEEYDDSVDGRINFLEEKWENEFPQERLDYLLDILSQ